MNSSNIKKILLFVAITILLVGLVSAAHINKTSNKDTKSVKDATKTVDNKANIKTEQKDTSKKMDKKTYHSKVNPTSTKKSSIDEASGEYYDDDSYGYHDVTFSTSTTNKNVKLNITTSPNPKTDEKVKITVKALNRTKKLNTGRIKVKFKNTEIANKRVQNGKISLNYKLPIKSGTYKITAIYTKNDRKLATKTKNIKVKDSEKMTVKSNTNIMGGTFQSFKVKVTKASGKVNNGSVRLKLNGKTLKTVKVKNGIAKLIIRIPNIAGKYRATLQYLKFGKVIQSINKNINVKYNQYPIFSKTLSFRNDGQYSETSVGYGDVFETYIAWNEYSQASKGAYVFLMNNGKHAYPDIPYIYRFIKATFYHYNENTDKIIKDTVTSDNYSGYEKYTMVKSKLRKNYIPYQVQVYYRKMTPSEKQFVIKNY